MFQVAFRAAVGQCQVDKRTHWQARWHTLSWSGRSPCFQPAKPSAACLLLMTTCSGALTMMERWST